MSADLQPGKIPAWTLGWRLQRSLAHAELTREDMAEIFEVTPATIGRWLNDKVEVKGHVIREWALRTAVPYEWLRHGETSQDDGPEGGMPQIR